MVGRSSFCNCSFPSGLYIPSLHRFSGQSCDWFEIRRFLGCPCEQSGKPDLKGVGLLQILIQAFLRLLELSTRFALYLLIDRSISLPCGFVIKQKIAECRSFVRRIKIFLRISLSRAAFTNLYKFVSIYLGYPCEQPAQLKLITKINLNYLASIYPDHPCEQPAQLKLFTKIKLNYLASTYLSYPCEQLARLRLFIAICLAAKIHSLLRGAASGWIFVPCETLKPLCLKRTFSTSWDRTVSDIAIVDLSCTGIPINTS
jgi:hypothetical protein